MRKSKPKPNSPKSRKVKSRVRARVSQAASIREFHDAVLANLDNRYWETATPVLEGNITVESYPAHVARLEALKEAGAVVHATLLEGDDEEEEDERERHEKDKN